MSESFFVVGLMSGTSVDGIDAALCEICGEPPELKTQVVATHSVRYTASFRKCVLNACNGGTVDEICRLNADIAEHFAQAVQHFIDAGHRVDLIGSHGQTVWHDVNESGQVTSTLQIGSGAIIAERTGITTINDFRMRDIAAGGQGAPLTSYVDWLLLRDVDSWRAVQNIGGMGNVTLLPPLSDTSSKMIAFDTGPGNALIDSIVSIISNGKLNYDKNGAIASGGQVDLGWLKQLLAHPYFEQAAPRTTGRELFGTQYARQLHETGKQRQLSDADIVATLTAFTAHSIADAYRRFAPQMPAQVILGGGGAHNTTLTRMLAEQLPDASIHNHEAIGLSTDFKEALVFAVLAYETWHQRIGCLPEQTGATHGTVLGQVTPGNNFKELIKRTWL